jgi:hypothetical protein
MRVRIMPSLQMALALAFACFLTACPLIEPTTVSISSSLR